MIKLDQFLGFN